MELEIREVLLNFAVSATFLIALFGIALLIEEVVLWLNTK